MQNRRMEEKENNPSSREARREKSEDCETPQLESKSSKPNQNIFCWQSKDWQDDDLIDAVPSIDFFQEKQDLDSALITAEPDLPPDAWLTGGTFGSRNALLVFKSSALATANELSIQEKPASKLHITYKVMQTETKLLSKLLDSHGLTEVAPNSSDFNLLWTGSHLKPGTLRALGPYQRVNHFPRSYELTRKDRLYKNIERMQHAKGFKSFDFIPQTFVMPNEYKELCSAHLKSKGPWIVKPVASSRGRGIFIVESPNQVPMDEPLVVAKYISNPLLVKGHKCDLRLYVVVTSFDPLIIYIYEEGLVRFATVRYNPSHKQLWNPCMHLCNYSINKYHSDYVKAEDPTAENVGHKWTLSAFLRHLKSIGENTSLLMSQIEDLIVKAVLASAHSIISACRMFVPHLSNCFELYGFDILIDENMKPWLLEVNLSPSLGCDSPLDVRLKSAMLADLLTLVGIPAVDPLAKHSSSSIGSSSSKRSSIKMKLSNCRQVHSADGLSNNTLPKRHNSQNKQQSSNAIHLSYEETRLVKLTKEQFERRGGYVRIFPTIDSWAKYSAYLDPTTGIPITGMGNTSSMYNFQAGHNYNLLIYTQLFPDVPITTKNFEKLNLRCNSRERTRSASTDGRSSEYQTSRLDRYERMLIQGHRSSLCPNSLLKESNSTELRKQVLDLMKNGRKMSQRETRKTFSRYLTKILERISSEPDQDDHIEIVLKFLQKASSYLRSPFAIKMPNNYLDPKAKAAIIAKQLSDFLHLYNRETECYVDKTDHGFSIPPDLHQNFLNAARESDLEEVLIAQTCNSQRRATPSKGVKGVLKSIPNVGNPYGIKAPFKCSKDKQPSRGTSLS